MINKANMLIKKTCELCGKEFLGKSDRRLCSLLCHNRVVCHLVVGKKNTNYKHGRRANGKKRSPIFDKCYRQLRSALESGKIKKEPCKICSNLTTEGHHQDYSRPYEVQWLCRKHHYAIHRV